MSDKRTTEPYSRCPVTESYDAIVIGSGIGGLATAALLAKHGGKKVLVLERHYTAGGYTHVFRRPGYEWDVGVHYIGDVAPGSVVRALFDEVSDAGIEWADMGDVYDRVVIGPDAYDFPKGREKLRATLKSRFPGEEAAIDAYFAAVERALATSLPFHAEKALPGVLAAMAGPLLRRAFLKWSDRTTREVLEGLTRNQRLIAVLTGQFGDYGLPPAESSFMIHAMVANHYFEGGFYPVGGSGVFAETIGPVIEKAGGKVLINAEVAEVVVAGGRAVGVKMAADGAVLRAPVVISDAGVSNTFARLVPREVAQRYRLLEKLKKVKPSIAHLCLYIGFKHSAEELRIPKFNLWLYPHENHEKSFADSRGNPDAALPLLYVSFPAAKDPDFARRHPGRATIDLVTAAPYEWFAKWEGSRWKKRGADYEAFKEQLANRMLERLYEHQPQLRGKVDFYELSTPLTTQHFCNYATGELYGLDHTPERFRQRFLRPATPIAGLYLTGQDVVTCGVAGALFGGVLTASVLLKRNLVKAVLMSSRERARGRDRVEPSKE
jgi:all-trans-retinol 13,14-reductase